MGSTTIDKYMATLDMTPSRILGSYLTHEVIFDFRNHFIPLQSAYNSSSDNGAGRPTAKSQGKQLTEEGEKTKDNDANADR